MIMIQGLMASYSAYLRKTHKMFIALWQILHRENITPSPSLPHFIYDRISTQFTPIIKY